MASIPSADDSTASDTFDAFFRRELRMLEAVAFGLTGRRGLAEELAQEAMLVVYRKWDRLEQYDEPALFARRVVVNKSVSAFRRIGVEARALARIGRRPDVLVEISDRDDEIWRAVRALPQRQAQAVVLRYVADLDTPTIAGTLECAESTVRVLLHRARHALAEALDNRLDQEVRA